MSFIVLKLTALLLKFSSSSAWENPVFCGESIYNVFAKLFHENSFVVRFPLNSLNCIEKTLVCISFYKI